MKYVKFFLILVPSLLICSDAIDQLKKQFNFKDSFANVPLRFNFISKRTEITNGSIELNALQLNNNEQFYQNKKEFYLNQNLVLDQQNHYFYFDKNFSPREISFLKEIFKKNKNVLLSQLITSKLYLYLKDNPQEYTLFKESIASQKETSGITVFILLDKTKKKELKNSLALFEIPLQESDLENQTNEELIQNINNQYQKNVSYQKIIADLKTFAHYGLILFKFYSVYATFQSIKSLKSLPKMPHTPQEYIKTLWHFFIYLPTLVSLYHYSKIGFGTLKTNAFKK